MKAVEGWRTGRLGELCSIEIGGTPSRSNPDFWDASKESSNLWVSIKDLNKSVITETAEYLTDSGVKDSNAKLQKKGTVLLSFKLSIGRVAFAGVPLYTNEAIAGLNSNKINSHYLFHGLHQWDLLQAVDQAIKGATLNKEKLKKITFRYPESGAEQTKIAEILSTVDRAIEQTEALIAKQQRIKTGLMQDLLTRGIDENGNLRSEQTHQFKDSPLGRIPVEWVVGQLGDVLSGTPRNGIYKPANQIGTGTIMIGQTSFTSERRINYRLARRAIVSATELDAYSLRDLDILVTRVFATVAGVGLPVLVTDLPEAAVYESNMLRLRIEKKQMHPVLLFYWLKSSAIRKRIVASVNASNQTSVNQVVLKKLPVLIAPENEQEQISEIISTQENQLNKTVCHNQKLHSLKTALMQGLLTGKKRVTALLKKEVSMQ